jgi:hypothetical protein
MNYPFGDMICKTVVIFFVIYLFVNIIYLSVAFAPLYSCVAFVFSLKLAYSLFPVLQNMC